MFCYLPHCWSLDSGNVHTFGECWLKWQVNARAGGASASYSLTHYSHSLTHSGTTLLITHHLTYLPWQVNAKRPIYGQRGMFTERFRKKNWSAHQTS